jgi:hypothetical protein
LFQIVWEFIVRADRVSDFEKSYAVAGDWAALFRRSAGFLGTALLRDADNPRRYLTIDRWDACAIRERIRSARPRLRRPNRIRAPGRNFRRCLIFEPPPKCLKN